MIDIIIFVQTDIKLLCTILYTTLDKETGVDYW